MCEEWKSTFEIQNGKRSSEKSRNISFDIIRILAIFLVMYNHRETYIYFTHVPYMGGQYILAMFGSILCKCGPPLFFMVSGALILRKKESFAQILKHRVLRIISVMFAVSIFVKITNPGEGGLLKIFITDLNWYLYAYIGYLLMLPFMRILVSNMSVANMKLFLILSGSAYTVSGFLIPFSSYSEKITEFLPIYNAGWASNCWNFIFPILGYILVQLVQREEFSSERRCFFGLLLLGTIISLLVCTCLMNYDIRINGSQNLEMIRQHANFVPCCFVFSLLYYVFAGKQITDVKKRIISEMSSATFGMFLIETHSRYSQDIYEFIAQRLANAGLYLCSIISILIQFILYFLIIFALRRIPLVKKVL